MRQQCQLEVKYEAPVGDEIVLCGKPAVDFVATLYGERIIGKLWLCAKHWDAMKAKLQANGGMLRSSSDLT